MFETDPATGVICWNLSLLDSDREKGSIPIKKTLGQGLCEVFFLRVCGWVLHSAQESDENPAYGRSRLISKLTKYISFS